MWYPYKTNKAKNLIILLTISLTMFCGSAYANPNPYFSLQLGLYHYDLPEVNVFLGEGGGTIRIAVGQLWNTGDRFKVGLEVGSNFITNDKGKHLWFGIEYGYYETKRFSVDALTLLQMNIYRGFNIFANAGVAYTLSKYKQFYDNTYFFSDTHYMINKSGSYSDLRPKAGLGMGIDINKKINVNLTFNHEFAGDGGTTALIGVRYSLN